MKLLDQRSPTKIVMKPSYDSNVTVDSNVLVNNDTSSQKAVNPVNKDLDIKSSVKSREVRSTRNKMPIKFKDFVVNKC